ncbi:MAG: hypothetical protein JWO43_350 [Candidatus Adlerbacteria bacterium]|nr:hypothetical protein [Candidatus Adlerbacteria bacterium]
MTIATTYAKALYAANAQAPEAGAKHLAHLRESLARRGHTKLYPQIFAEYSKLIEKDARRKEYEKVTPEAERTRTLLELYRKLITS